MKLFGKDYRTFQWLAKGIFCLFMFILCFVVYTAYSRKSGRAAVSMAKIQQIRFEAESKKWPSS